MKKSFISKLIVLCAILFCSMLLSAQEFDIQQNFTVNGTAVPTSGHTPEPSPHINYIFDGEATDLPEVPDPAQTNSPPDGDAGSGDPPPDPDHNTDYCDLATITFDQLQMISPTGSTKRNPQKGRWGNTFRISATLGNIPHGHIESAQILYTKGGGGAFQTTPLAGSQPVDASPWVTADVEILGYIYEGSGFGMATPGGPFRGPSFDWSVEWDVRCADGRLETLREYGNSVAMFGRYSDWLYDDAEEFEVRANHQVLDRKTLCGAEVHTTTQSYKIKYEPGAGLLSLPKIEALVSTFEAEFVLTKGHQSTIPYGAGSILLLEEARKVHFRIDHYDWLGNVRPSMSERTYVSERMHSVGFEPDSPAQQEIRNCDANLVEYGAPLKL